MKDLTAYQIELESDKVAFLREIAQKYQLSDMGKAVRCLVNWARENPDLHDDVFQEIRCLDC